MEKFGLSIKHLNNLWCFIKVYAVVVPNICGEKSARRKSLWRKNDKYEVRDVNLLSDAKIIETFFFLSLQ